MYLEDKSSYCREIVWLSGDQIYKDANILPVNRTSLHSAETDYSFQTLCKLIRQFGKTLLV